MKRRTVLIVEDNEINKEMLNVILSDEYNCLLASNGQEALDILKDNHKNISIILLDLNMPIMDGYTFLSIVKKDPYYSLIPIIVTTNSSNESEEENALKIGATDFVPKPYKPQIIKNRIASLTKLRETAAMVNYLQYDQLTGAYSKLFFIEQVKEKLKENPNGNYVILATNIENFKFYNEAYGRKNGDKFLINFVQQMTKRIGNLGFVGRINADKIVCFIEDIKMEDFNKLKPFISEYSSSIVIRIGIYPIVDTSIPIENMIDRAFLVIDTIKGKYSKYFAIYDEALRNKILRENAITECMESSLKNNEFLIYLQPKVDMDDKIIGLEALVRWISPSLGFLSPGEFIPLFEANGFIFDLNKFVFNEVCSLLNKWEKEHKNIVPISVNVSRSDVTRCDLSILFTDLINKYNLDPSLLHIEITESAYSNSPNLIIDSMNKLKENGFKIEMDDFGSGYSSLSMLSEMNIDILKLDMKLVRNETSKNEDESILKDIISMAHRLKLKVVAEGVETLNQKEKLKEAGCDYYQGYYFSKPLQIEEIEKLLNK